MTASSSSTTVPLAPGLPRRRAFSVVLAIELWERFGYYGMQAVLTLFMVEQLRMSDSAANLLLAAFSALTYITPLLGGLVGDRLLGTRRTMIMGATALAIGYALLAISLSSPMLLIMAMALISTGNGLFKPNAGNLVRRIYEGDDTALDAAFTLYYMSVNVGSTVSMLLMPWLQIHYGAPVAFGGCAVGLVIGLVYYLIRAHWLSQIASPLEQSQKTNLGRLALVMAGVGLCVVAVGGILGNATIARDSVICAGLVLVAVWIVLYIKAEARERPGLRITYLLCGQSMLYFVFYQQMITSLTLFALRAVSGDYRVGKVTIWHMSAGQFQSLNPIWIMFLSPLLAVAYNRLGARGQDVSLPRKMLAGYAFVTLAFGVWWLASANAKGLVSPWIMVAGYGLLSIAELLTSGLGLAIIARYAPARLSGFLMGGLYLLWGIAMYIGSLVANQAAIPADLVATAGPNFYAPLFRTLTITALLVVILLGCMDPLTRRWSEKHVNVMNNIKTDT